MLAAVAAAVVWHPNASTASAGSFPRHWLQYQAGPAHNAVFPGSLTARWERPTGGKINGGLALAGGTLYAVSFDKHLYAIDPATGNVRWSRSADNILMSTPVVDDGIVIVGSGKDGFLKPDDAGSQVWGRPQGDDVIAFTTGGRHLWDVHTIGNDMPSPAIDGARLYLANGDAHAYAFDVHSGAQKWMTGLPGIATMASATLHNNVFFTSVCHNAPYYCRTIAMREPTGTILWSNNNGGGDCTPTIDRGLVFVQSGTVNVAPFGATGGSVGVHALDERTGRTVWSRTYPAAPFTYIASSERQIAGTAVNGVLYAPISNLARMVAFNERTGHEIWSTHTSGNVKMSPVLKDGKLYFGDTAGILYTLDARTGRVLHTASYLQPFSVSPPVIYGQTLFIADGNILVAIPLRDLQ